MASQMIECYQLRCHPTEPQKRLDQNRSFVLGNTPYQNILNWLWTYCELIPELTSSQCNWKGNQKGKGTDETPQDHIPFGCPIVCDLQIVIQRISLQSPNVILVVNVKSFARNCAFFSPLETPYHDRKLFLSLFFLLFFGQLIGKKILCRRA